MDTVDFVIPHMGRPEMLQETVRTILAQTRIEQVESITVVTKNEHRLPLVEHDKLNILYAPDAASISDQRNRGVAAGRAPLVKPALVEQIVARARASRTPAASATRSARLARTEPK